MEVIQLIALTIFLGAIVLVIVGKVDRTTVALIGVVLMVLTGVMNEVEAFFSVDWNVIVLLISVWIIAGYFNHTGLPEYISVLMIKFSRNSLPIFTSLLGVFAGFISMFLDNVVVVLIMTPIIFHITKQLKVNPFPALIFVGLCANFMGTALLLGDLPPQMLHSVSGIEFLEFIWFQGKPSSFPILACSFLLTVWIFYYVKLRRTLSFALENSKLFIQVDAKQYLKDKRFIFIVVGVFICTIFTLSLRQFIGLRLGFIALTGALALIIILEVTKSRIKSPDFEEILSSLDWRAIFFYIALFMLVGGLEHAGILKMMADAFAPWFKTNLFLGVTLLYWVTAFVVGIVEHDAYIL
ncbi:MAG: SLC13 family permease, partial [Candidatus Bathyarchaeota archaeon]|nr:SLC13 family permease [Candidatus Bathyarchaeota archaeon]